MSRRAWVLNLDADVELATRHRYAPTKAVLRAMDAPVRLLAAALLSPDDVLVDDRSPPGSAAGLQGRAFCPTDRAMSLLARAGAVLPPRPTQDVLRTVNGRAFCSRLGRTLPGAELASDLANAERVLLSTPPVAKQWRVKRAFGMAGRGQRRIAPGPLSEPDRAFLRASITSEGCVQIEPDVAIVRELGIHGFVDREGGARFGRVVEQRCDEHGQWQSTSLATDVPPDVSDALASEASTVATALRAAGYFGPFGIDAFLYRDLAGVVRLQPRSEINARYSMGYAVGFPDAAGSEHPPR